MFLRRFLALLLKTSFLLPILAALWGWPAAALAGSAKVALVIGNGAYRTVPLKNPAADAHAMAEQLRRLGFDVIERRDATREQMAFAIREFGDRLKGASTGVFYFAGHGVQVRGRNYLIPVDTVAEREDEVQYRSIDANEVLDKIDTARAPVNVVILDACRNNPFARAGRTMSSAGGLASMDAPTGSLIAFSTAPGSVADDGSGVNGTYTKYLLRHIGTPGLAVENMFKRVRVDVARETAERQIPWESSSLKTDFSFGSAAAVPPAVTSSNDEMVVELAFWDSIKTSTSAADYRAYLEQYPQGRFAPLARARAATLAATAPVLAAAPNASPAVNPVAIQMPLAQAAADAAVRGPAALTAGAAVSSLAVALPDGSGWAGVTSAGGVDLLGPDGRLRRRLVAGWLAPADEPLRLQASPDGNWLALLARQGSARVLRMFGLRAGALTAVPAMSLSDPANDIAWTVSSRELLVLTPKGVVLMELNRQTGALNATETLAAQALAEFDAASLRLSPDGRWLSLLGRSARGPELRVLDLAQRQELWRTGAVAMDFSPLVGAALVAGVDGRARLVESVSGRVLRQLDSPEKLLEGRYSLRGEWLTTRDANGRLVVWNTATAQAVDRVEPPAGDGQRFVAVNDLANAALLATSDGWRVTALRGPR